MKSKNTPGCCDCLTQTQCLCDEGWVLSDWDFSVFGKSFSGTFNPATVDSETCERAGDDCIYDSPLLVVDTLENGGWVDFAEPNLSGRCLCSSCGGHGGLKAVGWQRSSAYSSRVAVWHHVQTYASAAVASCGTNQVKFVVVVIYSVTRIVSAIERASNRYKRVERDCDAGTQEIVGDWVYSCGDIDDYIISVTPQLPCDWPQLDTASLCPQIDNPTDPLCESNDPALFAFERVRYQCVSGVCTTLSDMEDLACLLGSLDGGCACTQPFQTCTFGVTIDPLTGFRANRRQYQVTWESECYDCDSIPSAVTLERISSVPIIALTGDVTLDVFNSATGSGCGTAPAVTITIPFTLTLNVS